MGTLDQLTGTPVLLPVVGVLESVSTYTIGATTTPPTPGTGATFFRETYAMGNVVKVRFEFNQTVAGSGGSGNYTLPLSSVFTVDTQRLGKLGSPGNLNYCGSGSMQANTAAYQVYAFYNQTNNTVQIEIDNNGVAGTSYLDWGSTANSMSTTTLRLSVDVFIPITASSVVAIGAGLATSVKAGLLNYYDTGSFVANFNSGMNTSTNNVTITYARLGPVVTLTFPSLLVTVGVTSAIWQSAAGTVPTLLRPSSTVTCSGTLAITNKVEPGTYGITSSGQLNLYRSGEANFTSGTTQCGIYFSTITYSVQ